MERRPIIIILTCILTIFLGAVSCNAFKKTPKYASINEESKIDFGKIPVRDLLTTITTSKETHLVKGESWKTVEGHEFGYLVVKTNYHNLNFNGIENRFNKKTVFEESEIEYIKTRWAAVYRQFDGRTTPPVSFTDKVVESSWGSESENFEVFGSKADNITLLLWSFSQ